MTAWPLVDFPGSTSPAYNAGAPTRSPNTLVARSASNAMSAPRHLTSANATALARGFRPSLDPVPHRPPALHQDQPAADAVLARPNLKHPRYEPLESSPKFKTCSTTSTPTVLIPFSGVRRFLGRQEKRLSRGVSASRGVLSLRVGARRRRKPAQGASPAGRPRAQRPVIGLFVEQSFQQGGRYLKIRVGVGLHPLRVRSRRARV